MNLIDAVKSGKPFRRHPSHIWIVVRDDEFGRIDNAWNGTTMNFSLTELLSNDWETQEPTVEITRQKFWACVNEAYDGRAGDKIPHTPLPIKKLACLLGLE